MSDDSIEGIYDTLKTCALISKSAGGIGLNVHNIRATGSYIAGVSIGLKKSRLMLLSCFIFADERIVKRFTSNAEGLQQYGALR